MLIKWIECKVRPDLRASFSKAQESWSALQKVSGFLGQIGGWEVLDPQNAYILGFWQDRDTYLRFMQHEHDAIFLHSGQKASYESINVTLFESDNSIQSVERLRTVLSSVKTVKVWNDQQIEIQCLTEMNEAVWEYGRLMEENPKIVEFDLEDAWTILYLS